MPEPSYQPKAWHGVSVKALIEYFTTVGNMPPEDVTGLIIAKLFDGNTVVTPELPPLWRLVRRNFGWAIMTDADTFLDAAQVFVRARDAGLTYDPNGSLAQWLATARADTDPKSATEPLPVADSDQEAQAITSLSTWLQSNPTASRDAAWAECCKHFPELSDTAFKFRVWPAARRGAGLSRRKDPGRPKGSTKNKKNR
jgi:hypothetical protein